MKITSITVRAGRVLPHPLHQFANIKADIEYTATLDEGDDPVECRRQLLSRVESEVEQHCADLNDSIRDFQRFASQTERLKRLESDVGEKNKEIETLRAELDTAGPLFAPIKKPANA